LEPREKDEKKHKPNEGTGAMVSSWGEKRKTKNSEWKCPHGTRETNIKRGKSK